MKQNKTYHIYYRRYPFRFGSYHAILRSLTIATLVKRLYKTSRLSNDTYERLLRTRQLIRVLIYYGIKSQESSQALDSINKAHKSVEASNDDFLYVLSTFFLEPLRWNNKYGTTKISDVDVQLVLDFWREIGERMGINNIPNDLEQWLEFQNSYEDQFMNYSDAGHLVAINSINQICRQAIPYGLRSVAKQLLLGTLDEKIRKCLKLTKSIIPPVLMMGIINKLQPNFEPKLDIITQVTD